ncbi:MAG TPA: 16S rRNA (cytosine(967)-C(5))-methyltransferase RsmB [Pyrinomonadaceae bacterium]|jgi:16S rRNA (cytosine967-C5)-methyltransferase|nr:16S rRNA (cytosine(967)-C(5))-methyltransferase RsmB [Pyrinomonadaceae bacterium]
MSVRATSNGSGRGDNRQGRAHAVSPARVAAFEILLRVETEGAFASVLLASINEEELSAQDRALCHELVLGSLRWQLWLDHLISYYARRGADKLDAPVRVVLRLGLYQLRFLSRIPASAAVNESVKLVRRARLRSADSFVNAVLRRATREPRYDPTALIRDRLERISVETSHPLWLIERWSNSFGVEEAAAFARSNNEATPTAFRLTGEEVRGASVLEELRAAGGELEASRIALDAWRLKGAGQRLRELARAGMVYLQDEASQLVAQVLDARAGERVLDACAAPGSKTTHIAARAQNRALVVAGDLHEHRLRTLLETSERQKSAAICALVYDAEFALPFAKGSFDRALVDAPCTGTGTLRRNPEIRWRISASDIALLAARQQRILCNASELVRRGGRLVYSTCSVEPEENEQVVEAFLRERQDFEQVTAQAPAALLSEKGAGRTWPQRDGADGFFIAAFERRS